MSRFKVGDSVSGETFDLGKIVEIKVLDSNGKTWYHVHVADSTQNRFFLERMHWVDDTHIGPPRVKRHDPKLDHYWDHSPS